MSKVPDYPYLIQGPVFEWPWNRGNIQNIMYMFVFTVLSNHKADPTDENSTRSMQKAQKGEGKGSENPTKIPAPVDIIKRL